jgi:transposase
MRKAASIKSCSRCKVLEREVVQLREQVAQLQAVVAELKKKLEEKTRASKRQAAPFRKDAAQKKPEHEKKQPGRKPGHRRDARPVPKKVDRTLQAPVDACPDCRIPLENITTHEQYQTDIPPVVPIVTRFEVQVGTCPCCGKRVQGQHPEQTSQSLGAANHSLGPRATATAADLKNRLGLPFRKIADLFGRYFNLPCCAGALTRRAARLADAGRGVVDVLNLQIRSRAIVHADETGWWKGGEKTYLHTLASDDIVLFLVGDRSNDIAREILGPDFAGRVCCDGYAGYDIFQTARCNAHPIRRVRDLLKTEIADPAPLEAIQQLLRGGLALRDRREELTDRGYRRLVSIHKGNIHQWIEAHANHDDEAVGRLARHLRKYQQEFLLYLDDPQIPATNNYGEGTLRFAVLLRKIGCCNRTDRGVETFETLSSLLATFGRRGKDFIAWAIELLQGTSPKFVPPDLLPPGFNYQIVLS